jgi:hypothetical protein
MARGTNFAGAIDKRIVNACACAIRDIQRVSFGARASTETASSLRACAYSKKQKDAVPDHFSSIEVLQCFQWYDLLE